MTRINKGRNSFRSAVTSVQDFKMQVQIVGEGPPLALVGGGLTGWKSWEPHAQRLAVTRTVARFQPLNVQYGLEDRPLPEGYSVEMESAALAAALDDLGSREPLDLVAWSYGALISLDFALDHPEQIRTLTLIEPPAIWVLPDDDVDDPELQVLQSFEMEDEISEADLERFLRVAGLLPPGTAAQELPQWPVWMEHRRSLRIGVEPSRHRDDPERLRTFERPVLVVTGTGTVSYYRRIQEKLVDYIPRVRTTEMPSGHAPHIESMDRFLAELARFHEDAGITSHHVTSHDGTTISYQRRGTGRPVLFVHGTTADRRSWSQVTPYLEEHVTVYAMDRRGRGESGDSPEYDFMREVEDVVAVVEAIGEPVVLFGHSFGGLCSLEAALSTSKIDRLILYEPALSTGVSTIPEGVTERIQRLIDEGELERAMEVLLREVAQIPEHELEVYRGSPLWEARLPFMPTVPRELAVEKTYAFDAERFTDVQVPVMLLLGGDSPPVYREAVERLDAALPNSRVVVLPGQQHMAHHMDPELVAREIRRFLRK